MEKICPIFDGALVDVYPNETINHAPGTDEQINTKINQETKIIQNDGEH